MDVTRATQLGAWSGWIETPEGRFELPADVVGTKDRSWGVRPVGEPLPGAPGTRAPQLCFLWAPINFADRGLHFMTFDDSNGNALSRSASLLALGDEGGAVPTTGSLELVLQPGTRWFSSARLQMGDESLELTPLLRFQMRGAGYSHPQFAHGRWHAGPVRAGETLALDELDPLDYPNLHVQHVVRATSAKATGIGVLEQLIIGPYEPCGLEGLLDGATAR
jgi:hypothetical protein